jgi:hypothetical protein
VWPSCSADVDRIVAQGESEARVQPPERVRCHVLADRLNAELGEPLGGDRVGAAAAVEAMLAGAARGGVVALVAVYRAGAGGDPANSASTRSASSIRCSSRGPITRLNSGVAGPLIWTP